MVGTGRLPGVAGMRTGMRQLSDKAGPAADDLPQHETLG